MRLSGYGNLFPPLTLYVRAFFPETASAYMFNVKKFNTRNESIRAEWNLHRQPRAFMRLGNYDFPES